MKNKESKPIVSVIIPAYNEEDYIEKYALTSIAEQNYDADRIETLVVANACTDRTVDIARSFVKHELQGRGEVLSIPEGGVGRAKNLGSAIAVGNILSYLDADTKMAENLLDEVYENVSANYDIGKTLTYPDKKTFAGDLYFWYNRFCTKVSENLPRTNGGGGFIFTTKDLLEKMIEKDGFIFRDDLETMEDVNFFDRAKKIGKFKVIKDSYVITSTRRYDKEGYLKWFFKDWFDFISPLEKTRTSVR